MANLTVQIGAFLLVLSSPLLHLGVTSFQEPDGIALVVGGLDGHAAQIIASAGLSEVGPTRAPLGAFAIIEHPSDVEKLRQAGAVFVLDGKKVLELCS